MSDTIVVPKAGRLAVTVVKVESYLRGLTLVLFQNDVTIDVDTVAGDLTAADFPGYADQTLSDMGDPYINADKEAESDSAVHTWTCNATGSSLPQTIYGWAAIDPDNTLFMGSNFVDSMGDPDPITITGPGQSISIQIFFEDGELKEEA